MPSRQQFVTHVFAGGWSTDFGPSASVPLESVVQIPFLIDAENCLYELDGGPHKMPGLAKLNSSELESGATIKGIFDYWQTGTGASSTQHRIVHVGTKIKRDDADGTFTDLFTGLSAGAVPAYFVLEDILVMSQDGSDVPKSWDGSTAQNLAGSPPNFAFGVAHQNRGWMAGVDANSSRLYYTALLDVEDSIGAGSGSIDIDPRDGDRIMGIASHRNELWIFKGPYKGSIHRITGSAPTGSDAFARKTFATGVGAVGHNTIFKFANDLGFIWSDGSVRSLSATEAFGDFSEAALSRPINIEFLNKRLNVAQMKNAWAAVDDVRSVVVFTLPVDGASDPNSVLAMDFRFQPVRWSFLPALSDVTAAASVIDQTNNNRRIVMFGASDGFVRKWGQVDRTVDGTGIAYKVTTPHLDYGLPAHLKTIAAASLGLAPKNDGAVTFGWQRDNNAQQTQEVTQGGGAQLGSFVLGTSTLGGASFVDRFLELHTGGNFRSIRYQIVHSTNNEDIEVHSIGALLDLGSLSLEN